MKILFTCGGTGGHIYPAIALYQEIMKHDTKKENEYLFVGSDYGLDQELFKENAITSEEFLTSRGIKRSFSLSNIHAVLCDLKSLHQAKKIIKEFTPDKIIATGGYPAFAITYWADKKKIPYYMIEPNVIPGVVNKLFSKHAKRVILANEQTKQYLKQSDNCTVIGVPSMQASHVRSKEEILTALYESSKECSKELPHTEIDIESRKQAWLGLKIITVLGGSCGADAINQSVSDMLLKHSVNALVIWITGKKHYADIIANREQYTGNVIILDYNHMMSETMAITDLLIARAGAMTIQEVKEHCLPALFVPFAKAAANHQVKNAAVLKELGVAEMITEEDINGERLYQLAIKEMLTDENLAKRKSLYAGMDCSNCNERIYDVIFSENIRVKEKT